MTSCANCGWSAPPEGRGETRDLVRAGSIAEAGYLVELLQAAGVTAVARPSENFSAAQGAWNTAYTVAVPVDQAEPAGRLLQAEANSDFVQVADRLFDRGEASEDRKVVNPWRMLTVLAIVVATGAALAIDTFGGGRVRRAEEADGRGVRRATEPMGKLTQALRESGGVFQAEPVAGGPRRRLRFLPAIGVWELSTDADRDGRYESHRRFGGAPVARPALAR